MIRCATVQAKEGRASFKDRTSWAVGCTKTSGAPVKCSVYEKPEQRPAILWAYRRVQTETPIFCQLGNACGHGARSAQGRKEVRRTPFPAELFSGLQHARPCTPCIVDVFAGQRRRRSLGITGETSRPSTSESWTPGVVFAFPLSLALATMCLGHAKTR